MNILKQTKLIITAILLLFFSNSLFSKKVAPKDRKTKPDYTIYSKIKGRDYQLYISFPKNYSTKDTITYPVLYVLDGEFNSSFVKGMRKQFQFENEIEDVIIVGIGSGLDFLSWYSNRYNNYTTTVSIAEDEKRKKKKW